LNGKDRCGTTAVGKSRAPPPLQAACDDTPLQVTENTGVEKGSVLVPLLTSGDNWAPVYDRHSNPKAVSRKNGTPVHQLVLFDFTQGNLVPIFPGRGTVWRGTRCRGKPIVVKFLASQRSSSSRQ